MDLASFSIFFETLMLMMFGLCWPVSIYKSWSTKFVRGKSPLFLAFVVAGYFFGTLFKLFDAAAKAKFPDWTTWLYVINGFMVIFDLYLYYRYRHNHEPVTKDVATDIAHIIEDELEHHQQD